MRSGLLAAACLVVGGLAVATLPATPAVASGQVCEGIVLDDGNGSAAAVQAGQVAPGASDLEAMSAAGDTVAQNDSGLVCAIDNYPANGLANCTATSGGDYYYWSYWSGDPYTNTWTYAEIGPSEHTVTDGQTYVQGWRYQDPGPSGPSATKPSVTPAAAFAQACPGVTPVAPSSGGGGSGSGGGGSGSGGSTPTTTAPTPTTTQTTQATAPAPPPPAGTHASGGTTTTTRAASVTASPGATASTSTTTTAVDSHPRPTARSAKAKLAASGAAAQGHSGGNAALPIVIVALLIALLGGAAWFRWRRRPGEE
ncbi:MAG TPA: hypothetical protein VN886_00975 [Acidimicrobiales bacterium]|nr:hypothetical protein [Acidimicrobiales bacterium]